MKSILKKQLDLWREQFPAGSRVILKEMQDPFPISPGTMGTLNYIDDAGQFHISWDTGRTLALIVGADHFVVISPTSQKMEF